MAMKAELLKEWINALDNDADVAVDDGGLALVALGGDDYIEIGGVPLPFDESPGTFNVEVSRLCCHSTTYTIAANSPEEAEQSGLEMARNDDANSWATDWHEAQVNWVRRMPAGEAPHD